MSDGGGLNFSRGWSKLHIFNSSYFLFEEVSSCYLMKKLRGSGVPATQQCHPTQIDREKKFRGPEPPNIAETLFIIDMAAISMNDSLRELMERTMLVTSVSTDESEILTLRSDIAAGNVSVASLRILRKHMVEMREVRSLHSYISGSKVTFPSLKPIIAEVSCKSKMNIDCR